MKPGNSIIQQAVVAVVSPTVAVLMGLQTGCIQPQAMGPSRGAPMSAPALDGISVLITVGPPPIPLYEQPDCPDDGYLWTPGYWAWEGAGYFWVPGTWVMAPAIGLLWTPGYWGWGGHTYVFHAGYWGPHVGFYGGVNYGHGYGGSGYEGGRWQGRNYAYNRAVTNVNVTHITNVYHQTVIVNNPTHIAYNGGAGGLKAGPTRQDKAVERESHVPLTSEQAQHHRSASQDEDLRASVNGGKPPVTATRKPAGFSPEHVQPVQAPGGQEKDAARESKPKVLPLPPKPPVLEVQPANPEPHPEPEAGASPSVPHDLPLVETAPHKVPDPIAAPAKHSAPKPPPEPVVHSIQKPGRQPAAPKQNLKPSLKPSPTPSPAPSKAEPQKVRKSGKAPAKKPASKPRPAPAEPGQSVPSDPQRPYPWPLPQDTHEK